jgi:LacI family transcriptional regulator
VKPKSLIAAFLPGEGVWREILLGFHAAAAAADWALSIFPEPGRGEQDPRQLPEVVGVLVGSLSRKDFLKWGMQIRPVVSVLTDLTDLSIPSVSVEDKAIGELAATHLLNHGQRDFSAFGWPESFFFPRAAAFRHRVIAGGGRFHPRWNEQNRVWKVQENAAWEHSIRTWLTSIPRPAAILAGTDVWGRKLNVLLNRWGVRVPEDIAVISVDNDSLVCETAVPSLSSVAIPWRKVGAEAARLMAECFQSNGRQIDPAPLVLIPPSGVVSRRSSDMLAVADENVADALRFIRDHATQPLNVRDILKHIPVGRHTLQRAFRKHVGRTMLDEVHRVRIERAKSLLATTDLPIPDVAMRCGFSGAPKLSSLFRRETGTTPGKYRRAFRTV